jgi:hypothetical protein
MKFEIIDYQLDNISVDIFVEFSYYETSSKQNVDVIKFIVSTGNHDTTYNVDKFIRKFGLYEYENIVNMITMNMKHEYFTIDHINDWANDDSFYP